ncbi:hypothetical protein H2200_011253 [Cladophialophora chaetospira]|uniref:Uncharacterized protein n=1 Tax=Cladophialophora chaetospira TaxID=386627 RepID=A0AA39CDL6_9EURO|nr:hypothetical protein H2200_011253 [Cladophialophora chaetospira]
MAAALGQTLSDDLATMPFYWTTASLMLINNNSRERPVAAEAMHLIIGSRSGSLFATIESKNNTGYTVCILLVGKNSSLVIGRLLALDGLGKRYGADL